ncbi:MAG: flagellar hook basal-body protein [Planctomycetes bacterium]|nr:flagellar hook basal-body protein [Planctomycetota bacterium]
MNTRPPRRRPPSQLLFLSLFAACHATPDRTAEHLDEVEHRLQALEVTQSMQWQLAEQLQLGAAQPESPATAELLGRLAALVAALEAAPSGRFAVEATAHPAGDAPASDRAVIEALRRALSVAERRRAIAIENLANSRTPGYHRRVPVVAECVDKATGMVLPMLCGIDAVHATGALTMTERSLDVALDGDGWLVVTAPGGTPRLSRAGNLQIDAYGRIVTGQGMLLTPVITVPNDTLEVSIDPEGRVSGRTARDADTATQFGRIRLARVPSCSPTPIDAGTYALPNGVEPLFGWPGDPGFALLKQGFLEGSNVQRTNELIELQLIAADITTLRRTLAAHGVYVR